MQRLLRFAHLPRLIAPKTLSNKNPCVYPLRTLTIAPLHSRLLEVFGRRNYSGRSGKNKGDKGEEGDAWDQAWETAVSSKETEGTEKVPWELSEVANQSWETASSWSTGLTEEHFEGGAIGRMVTGADGDRRAPGEEEEDEFARLEKEYKENKKFVDNIEEKKKELYILLKQVRDPGLRGSYLKDSEKAEMYRLHKENPEVYTVERLAKDYRIMRQRVHAILWLKEDQEEMEKRLGPLDDSIEQLLDSCPEFIRSADREFHVASLPHRPDFKVMPEDWEGTAKDRDEKLWEISQKEDEILYQDFVQRMNFNKMQIAGKVKRHRYSRRRPVEGWKFTIEELGLKGKRGRGGGRRFVSLPDGSRRPLDDMEKMYLKRETVRPRRKILRLDS